MIRQIQAPNSQDGAPYDFPVQESPVRLLAFYVEYTATVTVIPFISVTYGNVATLFQAPAPGIPTIAASVTFTPTTECAQSETFFTGRAPSFLVTPQMRVRVGFSNGTVGDQATNASWLYDDEPIPRQG